MAGLADLLQGILGQIGQSGGPAVTAVGDHADPAAMQAQFARFRQSQGAPAQAPQMPQQGLAAPQAPQGQPMPEQAPQSAPGPQQGGSFGDGISGLLQNLFNPQASARNQTVGWLTKQGLDQGTATLLASNKPALQQYLLKRAQGSDPKAALDLEKTQLEIDNLRNPTTTDIREFQLAKNQGYGGNIRDWILETKRAGATNVDARQMGTIPPGYRAEYDTNGQVSQLVPIPGGPVAAEADAARLKDEAGAGARDTVTDTITSQAQKARDLIGKTTIGAGGWAMSSVPFSDAADMYRYVGSMKSIAAAENLQAMRAASPTGGALGNASDADIKLLQDKAGALDPASPRFPEMLDEYERSLLRIVHGPQKGDAIFEQTRAKGGATPEAGADDTPPASYTGKHWKFLTPEQRKLWQ